MRRHVVESGTVRSRVIRYLKRGAVLLGVTGLTLIAVRIYDTPARAAARTVAHLRAL
jgi:hypothetical protein